MIAEKESPGFIRGENVNPSGGRRPIPIYRQSLSYSLPSTSTPSRP